jgi:hypothetical protein
MNARECSFSWLDFPASLTPSSCSLPLQQTTRSGPVPSSPVPQNTPAQWPPRTSGTAQGRLSLPTAGPWSARRPHLSTPAPPAAPAPCQSLWPSGRCPRAQGWSSHPSSRPGCKTTMSPTKQQGTKWQRGTRHLLSSWQQTILG